MWNGSNAYPLCVFVRKKKRKSCLQYKYSNNPQLSDRYYLTINVDPNQTASRRSSLNQVDNKRSALSYVHIALVYDETVMLKFKGDQANSLYVQMSLFMRKGTSWHEITFSGNAWQKKLCHS